MLLFFKKEGLHSLLSSEKSKLRQRMLANRLPADETAAAALAQIALQNLVFTGTVAGVWPLPGEMDLRPLLHALHARGHRIVLPDTPPRGERLRFRIWTPDTAMLPGRFGTLQPDGALAEPDMLFVPMLAFDRCGGRLGYGGGYYDRTLAALPGRARIGFGYAAQEVAAVPLEPHDVGVQTIVTELEVILVRKEGLPF